MLLTRLTAATTRLPVTATATVASTLPFVAFPEIAVPAAAASILPVPALFSVLESLPLALALAALRLLIGGRTTVVGCSLI